ncbi:NAD(P)/FAD-dependent oxidoreductase [Nocardioides sp.]|uniref:NAD(P)/FAD-dependent oxidoreductase n=1 Tax=Nocardioides sp. TaxID=35761 RepID=UPI002ED3C7C3
MSDQLRDRYDVVVIGGGAAGLNGALMLARSRRSVVVLDAGEPRNAPADGVHGLLGREGMPPSELLERGRSEVRGYGGHVVAAEVVDAVPEDGGFVVSLADGRSVRSRRLLVATGLVDRLPEVPGLAERWGRDVLHCPYCHGWEVRDQAIGVLGSGPMSHHQALLFRQLSDDVVYFTHEAPLDPEQAEQLAALGVRIVDQPVHGVAVTDDRLSGVVLADGEVVARDAVVVATRMEARVAHVAGLGLPVAEHPSGVGTHVPADVGGRTEVPGVWVAGNVSELTAQVGASASLGAMAGAHINADLVAEDAAAAVAARVGARA